MVSIHVVDVSSLVLEIAIGILHLLPTSVPAGMGGFDLELSKSDVYYHISWRFLYENRWCVVVEMSKIRRISTVFFHPMCTQGPVCASQTQMFALGHSKEARSHVTSIKTKILLIFVVLAC